MSFLIRELKKDLKEAKRIKPSKELTVCVVIAALLGGLIASHTEKSQFIWPVIGSLGAIGFTIFLKRRMAQHVWFVIAMTILAALHIPFVLFVPWTSKWIPPMAVSGAVTIDTILMLVVLTVLERLMNRSRGRR